MTNTGINIFPIFNQAAPGVWNDFANIQLNALSYNYGYSAGIYDGNSLIRIWRGDWDRTTHNYAFGAYNGGRMVGYIRGLVYDSETCVNDLYVLPPYQGMHVGRRLLDAAERVAALCTGRIYLYPLKNAVNFYRACGYCSDENDVDMCKLPDLSACRFTAVPVFKSVSCISNPCSSIAKRYNATYSGPLIVREHLPAFVYVDAYGKIRGYLVGVQHKPGIYRITQSYAVPHSDYAMRTLNDAFDAFAAHQKSMARQR